VSSLTRAQNQVLQSGDWELDVAMVRAVSALLEGLPLRPLDDEADVVRARLAHLCFAVL
jgi:hypothetical protein